MIDTGKLPFGAESILVSRMRRLAPEMVIVSLLPARVRVTAGQYAFVRAIPGKDYDWRFLKKVPVMVLCNQEHARVGLFEQLCREASPVQAWFYDEQRGFDVTYLPTADSVIRDQSTWEWQLDFQPMLRLQNHEWAEWIESSVKEVWHVQHHS